MFDRVRGAFDVSFDRTSSTDAISATGMRTPITRMKGRMRRVSPARNLASVSLASRKEI
jgi:hypothetical protein